MVRESNNRLQNLPSAHKMKDFGDHHLTVGAIKKMMDGALGSHGAWLLEPYADNPGNTGLNVDSHANIREAARLAFEQNVQLCVHAIGDRANRETLNIFEAAFRAHPEKRVWRWRVEHVFESTMLRIEPVEKAPVPRLWRQGARSRLSRWTFSGGVAERVTGRALIDAEFAAVGR
jgi:predicted amidohydrolase YtcJ